MKKHAPSALIQTWLAEPLPNDVRQMLWKLRRTKDVQRVAVMPDVHLAESVCVGTVFSTQRLIYPSAIGGDIGCGMAAIAFNADANVLAAPGKAEAILDALSSAAPIIRRHTPWPCAWLDAATLSDAALNRWRDRDGRYELGTLGRGNHFLEFQEDVTDGRLWLMVHTGSRGMGQAIRDVHLARADGSSFGLRYLVADIPAGLACRHDLAWARGYAAMNRRIIIAAVIHAAGDLLGITADSSTIINKDHNHVVREIHAGRCCWVHRKGANRARRGEWCLIPGSMGSASVHAHGKGSPASLCSSSHGAGRSLSRDLAKRRISADELDRQMAGVCYNRRSAHHLRDEAPAAYRDLRQVLRAERELVHVVRWLRPVLSYKG